MFRRLIATLALNRQAARMDPVDSSTLMVHSFQAWLSFIGGGLLFLFNLWMIVDAIRRQEWIWVLILLAFCGIGTLWYYFHVYRGPGGGMSGFELPGAQGRRRIKELQAQIHHLDKAHHHSQLGDVYFSQGKLPLAEASYRAAMERDPNDIDTRAHLGQCLLRQKRPAEARPLLEGVMLENPKHDYGHTMMALAETLTALGAVAAQPSAIEHVYQQGASLYVPKPSDFAKLKMAIRHVLGMNWKKNGEKPTKEEFVLSV